MSTKRILVTGATGQQGGAVTRHLLKQSGFSVRALSRDKNKPAARALAQSGAEVVQGDLNDAASIKKALEGAYGCYSVQDGMEAGFEAEVRQGKALADAAKAAGVQHFVYSSVVSADEKTGLAHFESKWQIEQHLRQSGLVFTTFRPVFFMQNWYNFLREPIQQGTIPLPMKPGTRVQQISVEDIGYFVAQAFQEPTKWRGRTLELAGDDLSMSQVAETFSRVLGRTVKYVQVPWDQFEQNMGEEMTKMYRWFEEVGYHVDINALRKEYPKLATLDQVLRQQDWTTVVRKAA
ncbi:MAG: NmrA/HSCARG family protein [Verrucomicrobia bacterium]|nr:MAG: NmrA/HSCARG family protein [Verrucomicrobiota bacterium]